MIKGFIGTSLIDYPGIISAVLFFGGCNYRCPFCHNVNLVLPERLKDLKDLDETEIIKKLVERSKFIDGVVITGGEPSIYKELPSFLRNLKDSVPTLKIKLDTNGSMPEFISEIVSKNLIDYIAVDIKSSERKYDYATGVNGSFDSVAKTINLLLSKNDDIEYEFRTTVAPKIVEREDIFEIAKLIKGCKKYALQQFKKNETLDPIFSSVEPYPPSFIEGITEELKRNYSMNVITRIY